MPYNDSPETLGEHIRRKRIESGHLQKDVATYLGVSEDCVTYWENNRSTPQVRHYPKIISYLGYYPFFHDTETTAGKLIQIRYCYGLSVAECAKRLLVSSDAIKRWERGAVVTNGKNRQLIENVWKAIPSKNNTP